MLVMESLQELWDEREKFKDDNFIALTEVSCTCKYCYVYVIICSKAGILFGRKLVQLLQAHET